VNETKLLGASAQRNELRTMQAEELAQASSTVPPASSDPSASRNTTPSRLKRASPSLSTRALEGRKNLVAGANKLDYHLRNVVPGRDFTWTLAADIRSVNEGEACPQTRTTASPARENWLSARPSKSATSSSSATSTPSPWARAFSTPTARK
jgi:prolyl-tRNA synthetase